MRRPGEVLALITPSSTHARGWGSIVDTAPDDRAARPARPRLVVSVTASVDGRVTLSRASRLLDEAAEKCGTPSVPAARTGCSLHAARRSSGGTPPRWYWREAGRSLPIRTGRSRACPRPVATSRRSMTTSCPRKARRPVVRGGQQPGPDQMGAQDRCGRAVAGDRVARDTTAVPGAATERGCPLPRRRRWAGKTWTAPCAR